MRKMKQGKPLTFGMLLAAAVLLCHGAAMAGAPILNGVNPTLGTTAVGDQNPLGFQVHSFLTPIVTDGTLVDDFEDGNITSKWGGTWSTWSAGVGTVFPQYPFTAPSAGGYGTSQYCGKMTFTLAGQAGLGYTPYVLISVGLKPGLTACDLTKATGFRYWYKGSKHTFKVETTDNYLQYARGDTFPASPTTWTQVNITWANLFQLATPPVIALNKTLGRSLTWVVQQPDGYTDSLLIDNVEIVGFTDRGIAVDSANNTNGTWQYSTNAGTNWTAFGALSDASATLLNDTAKVRFVPNAAYAGPATFGFRAWNQTDNKANGATGQPAVPNGGVTAYSSVAAIGTVQVQSGGNPPTNLTYSLNPASYVVGTAIPQNTPSWGGGAPTSFSVAPALPAGLNLSTTTGIITGTPSAPASGNYVVTASNASGSANATLSITVQAAVVAPNNLRYSPNPATYGTGTQITQNTPSSGGGAVTSYSVAPALPAGLNFNTTSGIITGTPTTPQGATNYVVTASNSAGSTQATLSITIMAPPANLTYLPNPASYPAGTPITANTPSSTGGPVASYSVAPTLPAGLSLSTTSGVITGTPTTPQAAAPYVVTATNAVGTATASLSIAIVAALVAPSNATVTPTPQNVLVGAASVSFMVNVAAGTPPYTYVWRKDGINMVPAKTAQTLTIAPVALTDQGQYTVVVTNAAGSTTSSPGQLNVAVPVKALFTVSDSIAKAPATINFFDKSTPVGGFTKRIWIFGDGGIDSSNNTNPTHVYNTPATYVATLLLMNGAQRADSMSISLKIFKDNPISISGKYSSPGKAEITFTTIPIPSSFPPPYADNIRLWYKSGGMPTDTPSSTVGRSYTVAAITGTQPYIDTVPVILAGADDICGFMTQVHWFNGSSWYWSDFNSSNGTLVVMKDTFPPVNNTGVSGRYIYNTDSVVFSASNLIIGVDTATVDSFAIWFGTDTSQSTPDFTDITQTRWFNLQAEMPTITATNGRDSVIIANPLFNTGVQKKLYCALVLKGKNDKLSTTVIKAAYLAGVNRPDNPIILHASAPSASRVILSWNPIGGVSAIRIWYRQDSVVPVNTANFKSPPFDSVTLPSITQTQDTISGLIQLTHYFFGAQVYQGSQWSYVTDGSSANATTPIGHGKLPGGNTVKITSLVFDTSTNEIKVSWSVDYPYVDPLEIGISYSTNAYPTIDTSASHQIVPVTASSGSAVVKLQETLKFSSLTDITHYYVALWERSVDGTMTDPTSNSEAMVASPYYNWQNVSYFTTVPGDINVVFNGNILLVTEGVTEAAQISGKIILYQPAPPSLAGFIPVGIPFYFYQPAQSAPFIIKIRCGTLPAPYSLSQVKIYRWENGAWFVDRSTAVDSTGYVWIKTRFQDLGLPNNNVGYPFMALIDTQDVTLKRGLHADTISARTEVHDTLYISDNAGNVTWSYSYATGGEAYTPATTRQGTLSSISANIPILIDGYYASGDNGLRATVTVSDGVHNDTINVSRQVSRVDSTDFETAFTDAMKWTPLHVTATLSNPDINAIFRYASGGQQFTYDIKKVRMFIWQQQKWVEYSDNAKNLFTPVPGMLLWIKTRESCLVNFGGGITPSLKQQYSISLTPGDFTDFALPFKFKVNIGDIIDQTGPGAENLVFYSWDRDPVSGLYSDNKFYFASGGLNNPSTTLDFIQGYTVYCPPPGTPAPTTLSIPPILYKMSKYYNGLTKRASFNGWAVSVNASLSGGTKLCAVYCGYNPGQGAAPTYYPVPPSFLQIFAGVVDNTENKICGDAIVHALAGGGYSYQLAFVNESSEPQQLKYHLGNTSSLPKGLVARVYNEATGACENFSAGDAGMTLGAGERQYRWLLVGSEAYLSKTAAVIKNGKLLFAGTYPNPAGALVHIRYSVPLTGVSGVKFAIFDMRGRLVWQKITAERGGQGMREIIWDGTSLYKSRVSAGIYIIRMEALDAKQKTFGMFEKKMTYMP